MAKNVILEKLIPLAKEVYVNDPLMQQVSLTQAVLESGLQDGIPSKLADAPNYNLFGIKGCGNDGSVFMMTSEVVKGKTIRVKAAFAKFTNWDRSFEWHKNLMSRVRYRRVINSQSVEEAFNMLYKCGYATNPKYPEELKAVYNTYIKKYFVH